MVRQRKQRIPPVHTWTEEIDETTVAGCASTYEIRRRRVWEDHGYAWRRFLWGISCFVLVERRPGWGGWQTEAQNRSYLRLLVLAESGLKFIGPADGIEDNK